MKLLTYLDEAGHSSNTRTVVVAGFAGTERQWNGFDHEWRDTLARAGVSVFHMKELENRRGEFSGWDEHQQKRPFLDEVVSIILNRDLIAVGAAVSVAWFNALPRSGYSKHEFLEDPYHLALQETLHILGQEVTSHTGATNVELSIAQQPEYMAQGRGYYAAGAALLYPERLAPTIRYVAADESARLQAADLIAYELRKACDATAGKSGERWPMLQLRRNSHVFSFKGLDGGRVFNVATTPSPDRDYVLKMKRKSVPSRGTG